MKGRTSSYGAMARAAAGELRPLVGVGVPRHEDGLEVGGGRQVEAGFETAEAACAATCRLEREREA